MHCKSDFSQWKSVSDRNKLWWDVQNMPLNKFHFWSETHKVQIWHYRAVAYSSLGADHSIVMSHICVCGALNHFWVPCTWKVPHISRNHTSQYVLKQNHVKNRGFPQLQRRREAPKRVVGRCGVRGTSQLIQYPRSKLSHVHILFRTEKRLTNV